MRVSVIGGGYVGLVAAAGLASVGHEVAVGEADADKAASLRDGILPIFEDGLENLVREGIADERLSFHADNATAAEGADIVLLALPTPSANDGSVDTSYVRDVVKELAPILEPGAVLVTKSTVPVGTAEQFQRVLDDHGSGAVVVSNPEFLREGTAVHDFFHPDRIVIGSFDPHAADMVASMYSKIDAPVLKTTPECSELIKYAANAYLATRVTFANSIANVCEAVGADVIDVLEGVGMDRRIGTHFMRPGPGFGGSCFPKDIEALAAISREAGYSFSLLESVIDANTIQIERTVGKIVDSVREIDHPRIALWGLAFKADTDDIRESPAVKMAEALVDGGFDVHAYDPAVRTAVEGVTIEPTAVAAATGADVLVIATEWSQFADVDLASLHEAMRTPTIVDTRNLWHDRTEALASFSYAGTGR